MIANDPIVRYAAAAVVVCTFLAALTVATHGYLTDPAYSPPPLVSYILVSGVTGALALLGVHVGAVSVAGAAATTASANTASTAAITAAVVKEVTNGTAAAHDDAAARSQEASTGR